MQKLILSEFIYKNKKVKLYFRDKYKNVNCVKLFLLVYCFCKGFKNSFL